MKKKTIKKKAPAYAFGIEDALSLANIAGGITQGLSDEFSKGDVAGQTIGGAAKGAMTGLSVGGPIGAAIGGVGGLLGGLFGARKRRKEAQRRARIKENQQEIAMGKSNAATAEQLYWEDNALASTFENGGILPDLAYVDNNEIIRDDAGNIMQVPNSKPGTDNHLIDASNLDSVLSDKLKRPGTNKTFAQEGKELVKMTKKSKGNDRFARTSDMLNSRYANIKYNQLLDEQEAVKAKKGIKPKVKGIPAYEDGTNGFREYIRIADNSNPFVKPIKRAIGAARRNYERDQALLKAKSSENYINQFSVDSTTGESIPLNDSVAFDNQIPNYSMLLNLNLDTRFPEMEKVLNDRGYSPVLTNWMKSQTTNQKLGYPFYWSNTGGIENTPDITAANVNTTTKNNSTASKSKASNSKASKIDKDFNDYSLWNPAPVLDAVTRLPNVDNIKITPKDLTKPSNTKTPRDSNKPSFDFSGLAGLEPVLYNFVRSLQDPEVEDPVLNPYAGAINRAMARRRLNIEPTLAANRRSRAINRQNMARLNPNTGMNLAYGNQLATAEYAQNASTYANRDNANNQYLGEYADMMNNLGQQYVQNTVLTNDLNARNRAAARNFGSTAAGQLGKWSQNRVQMKNQARRDAQLLPYLEDYLNAVTNVAKSNKLIV